MEIERQIKTIYRWWNDKDNIPNDHMERLEIAAQERISEMQKKGCMSGELNEEIDDISYSGWWEMSISTL